MKPVRLCLSAVALLALMISSAMAEWRATQVRQPAHYSMNAKVWKPIKRGRMLPRTAWIRTGRGGRLKLNRGSETMRFRSGTLVAIQKARGSRMTTLRQKSGRLDVSVRKRRRPHLTVRNRYMTAVVKGTTFRVSMRKRSSLLSVRSGLVSVRNRRGQRMDVGRGQYAVASRAGGLTGTGSRSGAKIKRSVGVFGGSVPDARAARSPLSVVVPATSRAAAAPNQSRAPAAGSNGNPGRASSRGGRGGAPSGGFDGDDDDDDDDD